MSGGGNKDGSPDLTPMLDMVFQLVTFFMLVINFKAASMDLTLKLPVLGSARPLEYHGETEPILINVDNTGRMRVYGNEIDPETFFRREASLLRTRLRLEGAGELPTPVIVRADRGVPFYLLNTVMKACQDQGFRHFALSAMTGE